MLLATDRKSTRLNSSHSSISYAVFCLKKKNQLCIFSLFSFTTSPSTEIPTLSLHDALPISGDPLLAKQVLSQLSYIPAATGGPSWDRTRDLALIKRAL